MTEDNENVGHFSSKSTCQDCSPESQDVKDLYLKGDNEVNGDKLARTKAELEEEIDLLKETIRQMELQFLDAGSGNRYAVLRHVVSSAIIAENARRRRVSRPSNRLDPLPLLSSEKDYTEDELGEKLASLHNFMADAIWKGLEEVL
jgi:hypothetical protein